MQKYLFPVTGNMGITITYLNFNIVMNYKSVMRDKSDTYFKIEVSCIFFYS